MVVVCVNKVWHCGQKCLHSGVNCWPSYINVLCNCEYCWFHFSSHSVNTPVGVWSKRKFIDPYGNPQKRFFKGASWITMGLRGDQILHVFPALPRKFHSVWSKVKSTVACCSVCTSNIARKYFTSVLRLRYVNVLTAIVYSRVSKTWKGKLSSRHPHFYETLWLIT